MHKACSEPTVLHDDPWMRKHTSDPRSQAPGTRGHVHDLGCDAPDVYPTPSPTSWPHGRS
eukprot:7116423-Pyramimonas_sp.AAC.1